MGAKTAAEEMQRAFMCLRLEVDASIVKDLQERFAAAMAEARRAALAEGRAEGVKVGIGIAASEIEMEARDKAGPVEAAMKYIAGQVRALIAKEPTP